MDNSKTYQYSTISYPFAVGTIKAIENRLLSKETAARLIKASEEEAVKILQNVGYGEGAREASLDSLIKQQLHDTEKLVKDLSPNHEETNLFLLPNDAHNLKLLVKAKLSNESVDEYINENGTFPIELLEACVTNDDYFALGEAFGEKLANISDIYNPQEVSERIDQAVFSFMKEKIMHIKNDVLKSYFEQRNDYFETIAAMRAEKMGWKNERILQLYGKEREQTFIEEFDRTMRTQMMNNLRLIENDSFGVGPLVCYLLKRRTEAVMLRSIFSAKGNEMSVKIDDLFIWEV